MKVTFPFTIAYDCTLKRPGCALLQALLANPGDAFHLFPIESWEINKTADMHAYTVTSQNQLDQLLKITRDAMVSNPTRRMKINLTSGTSK